MNTMIHLRGRRTLLALALLTISVYMPAHAGQTCDLNDGNPNTEQAGGSTANGATAFSCGPGNTAEGAQGQAFGSFNHANGLQGSAIGFGNSASGQFSSAVGYSNSAMGVASNAFGTATRALGDGSVAFGSWFDVNDNGVTDQDVDTDQDGNFDASSELTTAFGTHSTAIGPGAWGFGHRSAALGAGAFAQADDSVALGSGSFAGEANTVSVGSVGNERRIVNVAAGTQATDAVNVQQLQNTLATANAYTDSRVGEIAGFGGRLDTLEDHVGVLDQRLSRVGALSAALSMAAPDGRVTGANQFSMGVGHYRNQQALSLGYSRLVSQRAAVRVSAAFAGSDSAAGVGFNLGW